MADSTWYTDMNLWIVVLTGVLAAATIVLAIYTAGLFRETVRLGADAKATSDRQAADTSTALSISKQAADAASEQSKLSIQQLQLMERQFRRSHRPFMIWAEPEVRLVMHFDERPPRIEGKIAVRNFGSGLAQKVSQSVYLYVGADVDPRSHSPKPLPDEIRRFPFGGFVRPDEIQNLPIKSNADVFNVGQAHEVVVRLYHWIYYADEFGELHATGGLFGGQTAQGVNKITPNGSIELLFKPIGIGLNLIDTVLNNAAPREA